MVGWRDEPFWRDLVADYARNFPHPPDGEPNPDLSQIMRRERMFGWLEVSAYHLAAESDAGTDETFPLIEDSAICRAIYEDVEAARQRSA